MVQVEGVVTRKGRPKRMWVEVVRKDTLICDYNKRLDMGKAKWQTMEIRNSAAQLCGWKIEDYVYSFLIFVKDIIKIRLGGDYNGRFLKFGSRDISCDASR